MSDKFRFNTPGIKAKPDPTRHRIQGYQVPSAELLAAMEHGVWVSCKELSAKFPGSTPANIGKQLQDILAAHNTVKRQLISGRPRWSKK